MQSTDSPEKISIPFANDGTKRPIPNDSQIGIVDGAASFETGFPPKTFTPIASGGVPPAGADFNGLFNRITAMQRWQSAGGMFKFDSDFATAIGGYPKGVQLVDSSGGFFWTSRVDNNTGNPETGSPNWQMSLAKQSGTTAIARPPQIKVIETVSIDDYPSLQNAFNSLSGTELTGYGARPVNLDLLGKEITFTGIIFVPINVSLVNGKLTSATGRLVWRNPFLANTALRGNTEYWPWMTVKNQSVSFNCITVENCYIGICHTDCDWTGQYSLSVLVNSNSLWTEYGKMTRCSYGANVAAGAGIIMDGNISGTSIYSTGTGAGTADGSFGYNSYHDCKTGSTAPAVAIKYVDGATHYNGKIEFRGNVRGDGPSGAFMYISGGVNPSTVSYCDFGSNLESFGAASNVISMETGSRFWNNTGTIQCASPTMTFAQEAGVLIRTNSILVTGAVLLDKAGSVVFQGDQAQSWLVDHLLKRLSYVKDDTEHMDKLTMGTSVVSPLVLASTSLESRAPISGDIVSRPNDIRSGLSRNWAMKTNFLAFGDCVFMEGTTNTDDPSVARIEIKSGGVLGPAADNTQALASASQRFSVAYFGSAPIVSSDGTLKRDFRNLSAAEISAACDLARAIGLYRWIDAVKEKGVAAREHVGPTVQRAIEIMQAHGLNPFNYGFICHDAWEQQTIEHPAIEARAAVPATAEVAEVLTDDGRIITHYTPARAEIPAIEAREAYTEVVLDAGDRYAFRYDEMAMFIAAGQEARIRVIEARLAALEK